MSHLFSKTVISEAIRTITIADLDKKIAILSEWCSMYRSGDLQKKTESEFEGVYGERLFGEILGYTGFSSSEYYREAKPKNISNGQKGDIGLGFYGGGGLSISTQAVVELKDANTSLDRPQQREGNLTPVQQAFKYKPLYNSKWVIVSNFYEIRLYTDTYQDYESFTLTDLVSEKNNYENFRIFYTLFHRGGLINKNGASETEKLLAKVRIEEEKISKEFYKEYKDLRLELMRDIWRSNPNMKNAGVIEKAQRIIDRIVFICFCEDRGLLPQHELEARIQQAKKLGFAPWEMLKKFFQSIDTGDTTLGIPDGYNGGLFRADPAIDTLKISDAIIEKFVALGRYDFSEDGGQLSVEILGHIFEQSISDIEEIRTQIEKQKKVEEEKEVEKKISKRKKDGIFYTPAYIVNYIVENSLGKYLSEHEETLKGKYSLKEDITAKNYRKREIEAYSEYQKILHNVKVLDPACGSGAFLVRVFDWLLAENKRVTNILYETNDQMKLGDDENYFREILKNNIYGVDLNEESVEITKLSLWLKSAQKGKKLLTLDNNIKCGNSLIDDPTVAGDKAFNWNTEFADIMGSGGFDVIVGNPPYVRNTALQNKEKDYLSQSYFSGIGQYDLYVLFNEQALRLSKKNGFISFIQPNKFFSADYGKAIISLLRENAEFIYIRDLSLDNVFTDASVYPYITIYKKKKFNKNIEIGSYSISELCTPEKLIGFQNNNGNDFYLKIERLSVPLGSIVNYIRRGVPNGKLKFDILGKYKGLISKSLKYTFFIPENELVGISYVDERFGAEKDKEFRSELILLPRTILKIRACLKQDDRHILDRIYYFHISNEDYLSKFVLCILNSSITSYLYNCKFSSTKVAGGYMDLKGTQIESFRIPKTPISKQQPFIERADIMLTLNNDLQEKSGAFLANISAKYGIEKMTRKLEKWYEWEFSDILKELKTKPKLEEQEELMGYFTKRKSEVCELVARIEATDREIDDMVYALYGLTEEERGMIEGK